ncbi:HNH endonuclease [Holdemania sp. 1001302B_160321_E10]|uniref:HNH endonuclease n=1 Tax=Holdemania sp. 1001302B_160321_E10 TaxID=2787120 RepID=UPI001899D941|nr:HNH endonuclease [Holdemania sp. 1001302B_160321_E10]
MEEKKKVIERWEKVDGYNYFVSDRGRVKNSKGNIMHTRGRRYLSVGLRRNGEPQKSFLVHRLVAAAFVSGRTTEKNQVNHKDGNRKNNNANNLEWCTQSENQKHAYKIGLQSINYQQLMKNADTLKKPFYLLNRNSGEKRLFSCIKEAAAFIGCNEKTVRNIKSRRFKSRTGWEVVGPHEA